MNYELAKQLKDAGFPQNDGQYILENGLSSNISNVPARGLLGAYRRPSLSELIEACRKGFFHLRKTIKRFAAAVFSSTDIREVWGDSAEEAIAKLWFALNVK